MNIIDTDETYSTIKINIICQLDTNDDYDSNHNNDYKNASVDNSELY